MYKLTINGSEYAIDNTTELENKLNETIGRNSYAGQDDDGETYVTGDLIDMLIDKLNRGEDTTDYENALDITIR